MKKAFGKIVSMIQGGSGMHLWEYCPWIFAYKSTMVIPGGLQSAWEIRGVRRPMYGADYGEMLEMAMRHMNALADSGGVTLNFVFQRDPDSVSRVVQNLVLPSRVASRRLSLEIGPILDERTKILENSVLNERCYVVLTTDASALKSATKKGDYKGFSGGRFGQAYMENPALDRLHQGRCRAIEQLFAGTMHLALNRISARHLGRVTRELWDGADASGFNMRLMGDGSPSSGKSTPLNEDGLDHIIPELPGLQIFNKPVICDRETFSVGTRHYAGGYWYMQPSDFGHMNFSRLMERRPTEFIPGEVPFRMAITLQSGEAGSTTMNKMVAQALSLTTKLTGHNQEILEAFSLLEERKKAGERTFSVRVSMATWGGNASTAKAHWSTLSSAVENWGHPNITQEIASPVDVVMGTLPGFVNRGDPMDMMATDVLRILPVDRPVSPFESGTMLFQTEDGKVFPYQPGSSKVSATLDIFTGPPGRGKSNALAALNLGAILAPDQERFPFVGYIDAGFGSKGLVDLVRACLPKEMLHLAQHKTMVMSKDHAVNFFDIPLGCNAPPPQFRDFIVDILSLILTPIGQDDPPDGLVEFVQLLVREAYSYYNQVAPKKYEAGQDTKIDEVAPRFRIQLEGRTWFQIRDDLFAAKQIAMAIRAQRYAMPVLPDLLTVMSVSQSVGALYTDSADERSRGICGVVQQNLMAAVTQYPVFTEPTQLDFGNARLFVLDLNSFINLTGPASERIMNVMYLAVMSLFRREMYVDTEVFGDTTIDIADQYRQYWIAKISVERKEIKRLNYDELHLISSPRARRMITFDARIGRKYNVHIGLASQYLTDFPIEVIKAATGFWLMEGEKSSLDHLSGELSVSDYTRAVCKEKLGPPDAEGAKIMYIGVQKDQLVERFVRAKMGSVEIWSYCTNQKDKALRDILEEQIGFGSAVQVLARRFPGGSAEAETMERVAASMGTRSMRDVHEWMAEEMIREWRQAA